MSPSFSHRSFLSSMKRESTLSCQWTVFRGPWECVGNFFFSLLFRGISLALLWVLVIPVCELKMTLTPTEMHSIQLQSFQRYLT